MDHSVIFMVLNVAHTLCVHAPGMCTTETVRRRYSTTTDPSYTSHCTDTTMVRSTLAAHSVQLKV